MMCGSGLAALTLRTSADKRLPYLFWSELGELGVGVEIITGCNAGAMMGKQKFHGGSRQEERVRRRVRTENTEESGGNGEYGRRTRKRGSIGQGRGDYQPGEPVAEGISCGIARGGANYERRGGGGRCPTGGGSTHIGMPGRSGAVFGEWRAAPREISSAH